MASRRLKDEYLALCEKLNNTPCYDGRGTYDKYECGDCSAVQWTTYKDKGVTPYTIKCQCGGMMRHTQTYAQKPNAHVKHWVRPSYQEYCYLSDAMKEHVRNGGLILKTLTDEE